MESGSEIDIGGAFGAMASSFVDLNMENQDEGEGVATRATTVNRTT